MHIGLIGGIGPAATDFYYRGLIRHAANMSRALDLTMVHADAPTLLAHLAADNRSAQVAIYERLTQRLKAAGAECVVVTSIGGHFCIDEFAAMSPLPIIDLTVAVSSWLADKRLEHVGILGTDAAMASGMYGKLAPATVISPEGPGLAAVHEAYVTLAQSGVSTPALQSVFFSEGRAMMERGAKAILLGGTDINGAFVDGECGFPVVDCASIHIAAVADHI